MTRDEDLHAVAPMREFGEAFKVEEDGHCGACGDDELDLMFIRFAGVIVCLGCIEEANNAGDAYVAKRKSEGWK